MCGIASRTNSWWGAMRLIRLLRVVTDISETTVGLSQIITEPLDKGGKGLY
jgi:hypothetical protein